MLLKIAAFYVLLSPHSFIVPGWHSCSVTRLSACVHFLILPLGVISVRNFQFLLPDLDIIKISFIGLFTVVNFKVNYNFNVCLLRL